MRSKCQVSLKALVLCTGLAMLQGCGGGSDAPPPAASTISGTAAAGAPVIGQVTVKDANGVMRVKDINADGSYSMDVSGLTAPFVFRASGTVGGRVVTLVSAATSDDINHTINITPFTDLIVANMAGQLASTYFDNPDFAALTPTELNAAKTTLTQRLLPLLSNVGLTSGFDLLRTAFAADHSGFDAVMDVVRVTVDPATATAQIQDLVNNTLITDDLANKSDSTALPVPVVDLVGGVTDLVAVETQLNAFTALFATAAPSPSNTTLRSFFVTDGTFLDGGGTLDTLLNDITSDPSVIGIKLQPSIIGYNADGTLTVDVHATQKGGSTNHFDWIMKKVGGVWKIWGDQRPVDNSLMALNVRFLPNSDALFGNVWLAGSSMQYQRELELYVDYAPAGIDYVKVTGPGLPAAGVLMKRSTQWQGFVLVQNDGVTESNTTWVGACGDAGTPAAEPCIDFSLVPVNSVYTFAPLDSSQASIPGVASYTRVLPAAPASNADAIANAAKWFASISSITPAHYGTLANGSNIHMDLVMPTDSTYLIDSTYYHYDDGVNVQNLESYVPAADGHSVDFTWSGVAPTSSPSISVWIKGPDDRRFLTLGNHRTQ